MTMTAITWITMIGVLAFVWGGCGFWISIAMRKEAEKAAAEPPAVEVSTAQD